MRLTAFGLVVALTSVGGCAGYRPPAEGEPEPSSPEREAAGTAEAPEPPDALPEPEAVEPDAEPGEFEPEEPASEESAPPTWSEKTLAGLSLAEKVGQMIMPWVLGDFAPEGTAAHDRVADLVETWKVGGLIMSVGSPTDVAVKLNDLQRHADVPLLVAADLETGAGFRLSGSIHSPTNIVLGGATNFPSLMAVGATGAPSLAHDMGRITAVEARAVGIHVPFAPVLDVNNNPDNPIINTRSFGENPRDVAILGASFVRGVQEHGAIATGKHFPGHGDTNVDSHMGLPVIRVDRARLDTLELRPFQAAIDAGMGG
ncbi:MAG TPA: glycoside hydrolase family 3 N-terminal domain-containing protein, partial [Longimicrobiales bacterium]